MKIHTNKVREAQVTEAARKLNITVVDITMKGSRTHAHSFDVHLSGHAGRRGMSNTYEAATWDEWGMFIEAIYQLDEDALVGMYGPYEVFREATTYRFDDLTPEQGERRHKFVGIGNGQQLCQFCETVFDTSPIDEYRKSKKLARSY